MLKKDKLTSVGIKYLLPISLTFLVFGCSLWRDFTTYFNTYYNAKTLFEEVEEEILAIPSVLFEFKETKLPAKINTSLEKIIEKCSKIMQYETESSFFDDALLMTGKAFYYQQNYSKALRKFKELSALEDNDFLLESRLWEGKSKFQLREYEAAYELLDEVKAEALKEENEEIFTEAFIAQISYLIFAEEYLTAINQSENFVAASDSDELKAEIYYELGKLYLSLGNLEDAERVFQLVSDYSPTFNVEFSSKLELARIKRKIGETEESLDLFNEIKNENKFADSLGIVELEIADIYYLNGEIDRAYDHLTYIDTTFIKDPSSGIAKFRRAEIFELDYMQYDTAMIFYGNAMSSLAPKSLKEQAKEKYRLFDKYNLYHTNLAEDRRLLSYIEDPSLYVKDSLAYEEYLAERFVRADSIANSKQLAQEMLSNPNTDPNAASIDTETRGDASRDQTTNRGDWMTVKDPNAKDEVIMYAPPKPTISADSVNKLMAKEYFELGNLFFTDLDVPDSAFIYYEKVLTEYPDNRHYIQALYAKGTYYAFVEEKAKADSIFQIIYDDYPDSKVYEEAARQLGKIKSVNESDPAYPLYLEAEERLFNEQLDSAIVSFRKISDEYAESPLAPKALYAIGYLLENDFQNYDSAAVIYQSLADNFADSYYAKMVSKKLSFYIEAHKPPVDSSKIALDSAIVQSNPAVLVSDSTKTVTQPKGKSAVTRGVAVPDSAAIKRVEKMMRSRKKNLEAKKDSTLIEE